MPDPVLGTITDASIRLTLILTKLVESDQQWKQYFFNFLVIFVLGCTISRKTGLKKNWATSFILQNVFFFFSFPFHLCWALQADNVNSINSALVWDLGIQMQGYSDVPLLCYDPLITFIRVLMEWLMPTWQMPGLWLAALQCQHILELFCAFFRLQNFCTSFLYLMAVLMVC